MAYMNPYIYQPDRYTTETIAQAWILYNGIDRVDNERGYYLLNCVPCCKVCNRAKHTMTVESFEAWIARLIEHQGR